MESRLIVKIESKPINNPLYGKLSNTVCITEICEMEKFEVEMPDFSSVELTFSVKDDKYTVNANAVAFGLTSVERTFVLFFCDTQHRVFEFDVYEDNEYFETKKKALEYIAERLKVSSITMEEIEEWNKKHEGVDDNFIVFNEYQIVD